MHDNSGSRLGRILRRKPKPASPRRLAPSSPDPVAAALSHVDEQALVARIDGAQATRQMLAGLIDVHDDDSVDGFNTRIDFSDELAVLCDPYEDGLERALAEQVGINDVFAEDREVCFVSSSKALADVHAAAIRAVVDVNVNPRPPLPSGNLTEADVAALTDRVSATLTEAGFTRCPTRGSYFNRVTADGLVHVLMLAPASGMLSDGTVLAGRVWLFTGLALPGVSPAPENLPFYVPGYCIVSTQTYPTPDTLMASPVDALAWFAPYTSKQEWARSTAANPGDIDPPILAPKLALLFARAGMGEEARRVLDHAGRLSPSLADRPEAVEARTLLRPATAD